MCYSDYQQYEDSLSVLIDARDKWLKPGGIIFPDMCHIYLAAVQDEDFARNMNYWNNVYGFGMDVIQRERMSTPCVCAVKPRAVRSIFFQTYTPFVFLKGFFRFRLSATNID